MRMGTQQPKQPKSLTWESSLFFYLTTEKSDHVLLSKAYSDSQRELYLDAGWSKTEASSHIDWRKGYSLDCVLDEINPEIEQRGHYCIIRFNKNKTQWDVYHDDMRGFPIFYNDHTITNLPGLLTDQKVRANRLAPISIKKLTLSEATDLVQEELTNNIRDFVKYNNKEICITQSRGYDLTALQAIMDHADIAYTNHIPIDRLYFYNVWQPKHDSELMLHLRKHYWGYLQLRPSPKGMALITGFNGDEFLMRNPGYVSYVCAVRGLSLSEYIANYTEETYMTSFIKNHYLDKIKSMEEGDKVEDVQIMKVLENDFQMWHYNETITVLPWKSRNIIRYGFGLDTADILDQLLNARIQHNIISALAPELLETITTHKNIYEQEEK